VSIAMEVISADEIKGLGMTNIDDILSDVSNTVIEKARDGYRVAIRGITDSSTPFHGMSTAQPAVAINTDGVYSNRKDTVAGLFDIERVEVLYGPQSTMYSSNSPGGIVNVVTAQPKLDRFSASGLIEVGNFKVLHGEAAVNVPLSERIALRSSVFYSKRGESYVTNATDREDTRSARLRMLFQANDKLSFILTGEYSQDKSSVAMGVLPFDYQDGHWYTGNPLTKDGEVTNPWTGEVAETHPESDQKIKNIKAQINWDTDYFSLSMTPSYSMRDGEAIEIFPAGAAGSSGDTYDQFYKDMETKEKAMETRVTSPSDFFMKWMLGVNIYRGTDYQSRYSNSYVTTGNGDWSDMFNETNTKAIYGNVTYPLIDVFRLTAGYRHSWDETTRTEKGRRPFTTEDQEPVTDTQKRNNPDYKFGFEYDLGKNSMLYGDYATSYRVNQMRVDPTNLSGVYADYDPPENAGVSFSDDDEILKAYTLGAKNRFFDNKLQLNIAAYYYDYKNYQARGNERRIWLDINGNGVQEGSSGPGGPPPGSPGGGSSYTEFFNEPYANGTGNGRMIGFDLSSTMIITQNDMVNLSVSYQDSEWTKLWMVYYYDYTNEFDENGNVVLVYHPEDNFKGKPMMNTPPWTVSLSYDHSFNLWNGAVLKATLSTKYRTAYRLSWKDSDYPLNYQESYHIDEFQAIYSSPGGGWTLSAYVKNIWDYAEKRMYMSGMGGMMSIGNPRTYGSVLSVKF
jgi:iron complex outermembrane recepter protein